MFVNNVDDGSGAWYTPNPAAPQNGACYSASDVATAAFTDAGFDVSIPRYAASAKALFGITKCAAIFAAPTLSELGIPIPNGGTAEIRRFQRTGDLTDLHEAMHLVSLGGALKKRFQHPPTPTTTNLPSSQILTPSAPTGIIDQPAVVPPESNPPDPNVWLTNRNWASWSFSTTANTYGYILTALLGLAAPLAARLNAENFVIFALCMYFAELDCLGAFQYDIRTKRSSVTAGLLSEKAMRRIREGKFDLTRDVPLDRDLGRRGGKVGSEKKEGGRRFRDEDGPEMMLG